MIKSKWVIIFTIISGIVLLLPILVYVLFFINHQFSHNPNDWGQFGGYIGGILTPIIAIITVLILGYLTYLVSKANTEEARKLFFLEQKITVYQNISILSNNIDIVVDIVRLRNDLMCRASEFAITEEIAKQYFKAMEATEKLSQLKIGIQHFEQNYGHLFRYDFNSSDFKELKELLRLLYIERTAISKKNKDSIGELTYINEERLIILLDGFLSEIKKELI
jgi:hypothetical protein